MADLKKIGEDEFEETVLNSEVPVVVLFKSEWCPGCKLMVPVAEELADEGTKTVYVDVAESPSLAAEYGVMSIPATIVFVDGKAEKTFVGAVARNQITEVLK